MTVANAKGVQCHHAAVADVERMCAAAFAEEANGILASSHRTAPV